MSFHWALKKFHLEKYQNMSFGRASKYVIWSAVINVVLVGPNAKKNSLRRGHAATCDMMDTLLSVPVPTEIVTSGSCDLINL